MLIEKSESLATQLTEVIRTNIEQQSEKSKNELNISKTEVMKHSIMIGTNIINNEDQNTENILKSVDEQGKMLSDNQQMILQLVSEIGNQIQYELGPKISNINENIIQNHVENNQKLKQTYELSQIINVTKNSIENKLTIIKEGNDEILGEMVEMRRDNQQLIV